MPYFDSNAYPYLAAANHNANFTPEHYAAIDAHFSLERAKIAIDYRQHADSLPDSARYAWNRFSRRCWEAMQSVEAVLASRRHAAVAEWCAAVGGSN